jgi:hypothetical protein
MRCPATAAQVSREPTRRLTSGHLGQHIVDLDEAERVRAAGTAGCRRQPRAPAGDSPARGLQPVK